MVIFKSSLELLNVNIIPSSEKTTSYTFLGLVYLQKKFAWIENVSFEMEGVFLWTFDPCSIYIKNIFINIDYCH